MSSINPLSAAWTDYPSWLNGWRVFEMAPPNLGSEQSCRLDQRVYLPSFPLLGNEVAKVVDHFLILDASAAHLRTLGTFASAKFPSLAILPSVLDTAGYLTLPRPHLHSHFHLYQLDLDQITW